MQGVQGVRVLLPQFLAIHCSVNPIPTRGTNRTDSAHPLLLTSPNFSLTFFIYLYLIGCFQVLGVTPNADEYDIKKAYFELARKYHPSINSESPTVAAAATQAFQKIRQAYEDMLNDLVDSMETTLNNKNKSSSTSMDFKQPIATDADNECDSQDEESPAQRISPKPTPESGQSVFITPPHTPPHTFAEESNNFFIFPEPTFKLRKHHEVCIAVISSIRLFLNTKALTK